MYIYLMVDKKNGTILGLHHVVDAEGRSGRISEQEVLDGLPPGVERDQVDVMSAEVGTIPSSREATFDVDLESHRVTIRKVQQDPTTAAEA